MEVKIKNRKAWYWIGVYQRAWIYEEIRFINGELIIRSKLKGRIWDDRWLGQRNSRRDHIAYMYR